MVIRARTLERLQRANSASEIVRPINCLGAPADTAYVDPELNQIPTGLGYAGLWLDRDIAGCVFAVDIATGEGFCVSRAIAESFRAGARVPRKGVPG